MKALVAVLASLLILCTGTSWASGGSRRGASPDRATTSLRSSFSDYGAWLEVQRGRIEKIQAKHRKEAREIEDHWSATNAEKTVAYPKSSRRYYWEKEKAIESYSLQRSEALRELDARIRAELSTYPWVPMGALPSPRDPQLDDSWREALAKSPDHSLIDWAAWAKLNQEAKRAWDSLVTCNLGDVELARVAYYKATRLCSRSEEEGTRVFATLVELHAQARDFLKTQALERFTARRGKDLPVPFHPFLTQVMLEYVSTVVRFFTPKPITAWKEAVPPAWIDPAYSRSFMEQVEQVYLLPESDPDHALAVKDSTGATSHAAIYVRSHLILSWIGKTQEKSSYRWGLWPHASVALVNFVAIQTPRRSAWKRWDAGQPFDAPIARLADEIKEISFPSELPGPRANSQGISAVSGLDFAHPSGDVVREFRALAGTYGLSVEVPKHCASGQSGRCFAVDPSHPQIDFDALGWD